MKQTRRRSVCVFPSEPKATFSPSCGASPALIGCSSRLQSRTGLTFQTKLNDQVIQLRIVRKPAPFANGRIR